MWHFLILSCFRNNFPKPLLQLQQVQKYSQKTGNRNSIFLTGLPTCPFDTSMTPCTADSPQGEFEFHSIQFHPLPLPPLLTEGMKMLPLTCPREHVLRNLMHDLVKQNTHKANVRGWSTRRGFVPFFQWLQEKPRMGKKLVLFFSNFQSSTDRNQMKFPHH